MFFMLKYVGGAKCTVNTQTALSEYLLVVSLILVVLDLYTCSFTCLSALLMSPDSECLLRDRTFMLLGLFQAQPTHSTSNRHVTQHEY